MTSPADAAARARATRSTGADCWRSVVAIGAIATVSARDAAIPPPDGDCTSTCRRLRYVWYHAADLHARPLPNGLPLHRVALEGTRADDDPRRLRRRRAHRAPRGERDGPLPRAPRVQGRREVRRLPQGQRDGRADGRRRSTPTPSHDLVAFHITVRAEAAMEAIDLLTDFVGRPKIDAGGARPRARRRDPGDPALQGPAVGGGRGADRPRRVRRPPARPHRARPRGAPAHVHARGASSPSASAAGRARAAARSSSATSTTSPTNGASTSCSRASRRCPRPRPSSPRRRSRRACSSSERDTNQSHLRMSYRPTIDVTDRAPARRADDLLDAAGRLDGLAPVRRDPRAARPLLLGLRDRPRVRRRRRCCSSAPGWSRRKRVEAYTRMREIVAELRRRRPDRGGGRAGAGLRRRPPRAGLREHERGRPLRGEPGDRLRRGHRPRRRRSRVLDAVTFDEVAAVAATVDPERRSPWPASARTTKSDFA